jgi:peptide/nickel transport system ATP-binding protein
MEMETAEADETMLSVENLRVAFDTEDGELVCVEDVDFEIKRGEVLGIVGESGCGKSVTALSLMGLLGKNGSIKSGSIWFDGTELRELSRSEMRSLRGNRISMIFQEPMTSLNPVMTIGRQLLEPIETHLGITGTKARELGVEWLGKVGIPRPDKVFDDYPDALSGGMRQRVMIAMAMLCEPSLLIADEPTTALDVTIQAQILDLMEALREETSAAILLITHDLGVMAESADRVIVMYAGQIVEEADVFSLFADPQHPYTAGLLASVPNVRDESTARLESIPGTVPSLRSMPSGCRFQARCAYAQGICSRSAPPLTELQDGRRVRCWLKSNEEDIR